MEKNNQLQVFVNEELGKVRVNVINEEPTFNLYDVCFVLGYTKESKGTLYLRKDLIENMCRSVGITGLSPTDNGIEISKELNYDEIYIIEEDLYEFIIESRAKHARKFRKWITTDVIPSIRKHGAYMTDEVIERTLTDPDFIIKLATQLKEERQKRLLAEKTIEEQKPLVGFAETCLKSNDNVLMRELSKVAKDEGIEIGQNRLYDKLREWNLIMKGSTEPYQYGMERKWFVVEEKSVNTPYGVKLTRTTKVTPKGQVYIIEKLKKEFINN